MNKQMFLRLQALDECLRDTSCKYFFDDLCERVNRRLTDYGETEVTIRTIRQDLRTIQSEPYNAVLAKRMVGHSRVYAYEDPDFTIIRTLYPDRLKETLAEVLEFMGQMDDAPQIQWVKALITQLSVGANVAGGRQVIVFQNNPELKGLNLLSDILRYIISRGQYT